jgi:uncharacterized NAD-dependent epimerase/dehydratase family protein
MHGSGSHAQRMAHDQILKAGRNPCDAEPVRAVALPGEAGLPVAGPPDVLRTLGRVTTPRRLLILTEGRFQPHDGKTAMGVIRYGSDRVVALLDSVIAGRNVREWLPGHDIPIVAELAEAMALPEPPDSLLIGIAPTGGKLPPAWRRSILAAIDAGLEIRSGLHTLLGDDQEFSAAAGAAGVRIVDYRRPPERHETAVGRPHAAGKRVILTVGTDCAIGKMSVALELRKAGLAAGDAAVFVPTGQTGMMIDGWGVAVDRVIADFLQGTVEWLVEEGEARGDWVIVEGQGSLDHPAYSSVTLGLIHGATPHAMVMVHKPGLAVHDFDHRPDVSFPIARLPEFIRLHEAVAAAVAPSRVVAVALNTSLIAEDAEARRVIEATSAETGLPADDPVRFGGARLWSAIRAAVNALPWVASRPAERTP